MCVWVPIYILFPGTGSRQSCILGSAPRSVVHKIAYKKTWLASMWGSCPLPCLSFFFLFFLNCEVELDLLFIYLFFVFKKPSVLGT